MTMKEAQAKKRREVAGTGEGRNECRRFTCHFFFRQRQKNWETLEQTERLFTPNDEKLRDLMWWVAKRLRQ